MKTLLTLLIGILLTTAQVYSQAKPPKPVIDQSTQPTIITSDQFKLDIPGRKGTFLGKVIVEGPNFQMTSSEAIVYLSEDNKPERFVATGDIRIKHSNRRATARQAEYDIAEQKITLTGEPIVMERENRVTGQTIVIYPEAERMDVIGRSTVKIFP